LAFSALTLLLYLSLSLNSNRKLINFMVAPCTNNIKHFIVQLMHTNYNRVMAAYAAITLPTSITTHWYQICNISQALDVAP